MNLEKYTHAALDKDGDIWGRRYGIRMWECLTNPDKGSTLGDDLIEGHGPLIIAGIVGRYSACEHGNYETHCYLSGNYRG
jgi:hypothetical protein